jgi:hypothetical protein
VISKSHSTHRTCRASSQSQTDICLCGQDHSTTRTNLLLRQAWDLEILLGETRRGDK